MSKKLLSCGGLYIDDETIKEEDGVLSASGGGSSLPEVTAEDNGDVLTVVEGTWTKATPTGDGALMCTLDTATLTLDKTWQEILDAMEAGTALVNVSSGGIAYSLVVSIWELEGTYGIYIIGSIGVQQFTTNSASGYPKFVTSPPVS